MLPTICAVALLGTSFLPPQDPGELQRRDPVAEAHAQWNAAQGEEWLLSRRADLPVARHLWGRQTEPLFVPRSDDEFLELGRMVVDSVDGMFRVDSDTLVDGEVKDLFLSRIGTTDKVAVEYLQQVRGIPVVGASVNILFTPQGGLLSLDSQALPGVEDMNLRPDFDPFVAVTRARAEFLALEGVQAVVTGQPELVIISHRPGKWAEPRLAWSIELRNEVDINHPHARTMFMAADFEFGLLEARQEIHHQQIDGHIESYATPGTASGAINPPALHVMPYMNLTSPAGNVTTDVNGDFTLFTGSSNPVSITARYQGPYARVVNQAGVSYSQTQSFTPGVPSTMTMNTGQTEYVTSEASCYDSVIDMREWLKAIDPNDTHLDFQVLANANLNQTCNAYFNGNSINMFRAGGSCANTGFSTVVAHEEGHWANVLYGSGNGSDGFGEGNADVFAMYIYDTPLVGQGFFTSGGNIRSGLNTRQFCGNSNPGCYGQVHADGEVLMGALWKVRARMNTSLGNQAGDTLSNTLMVAWMNAYNDGQIRTFIEEHWLALDDNDGNIFNGTPNFADIDGGFRDQGFPGVTLQLIDLVHTPLGDTVNESGPYLVSADFTSLVGATITGGDMTWSVDGGPTAVIPMINTGGNTWEASIPGQPSPARVKYHIEAFDSLGNSVRDPLSGDHQFVVGVRTVAYANDFEGATDEGWTHAQVAVQDDWQRGTPAGKSGSGWADPNGAYGGFQVLGQRPRPARLERRVQAERVQLPRLAGDRLLDADRHHAVLQALAHGRERHLRPRRDLRQRQPGVEQPEQRAPRRHLLDRVRARHQPVGRRQPERGHPLPVAFRRRPGDGRLEHRRLRGRFAGTGARAEQLDQPDR